MTHELPISVIIPSYKNEQMLLKNLTHNLKFLKDCEVIVVNDYPQTPIANLLAHLPVHVIERQKNGGFGPAVNSGISQATRSHLMLLNTDVILHDDSYKRGLDQLVKDDRLFGVSFVQIERDGSRVGKNDMYWDRGLVQHRRATDLKYGENGWAEGGSCILKKSVVDSLGGFDEVYAPFYWEDVDLSYRAKKAGYSVIFDPEIEVTHHHETTTGTFDKTYVKMIAFRNQLLFTWRNISHHPWRVQHAARLSKLLTNAAIHREWWVMRAYYDALKRHATISHATRYATLHDTDILKSHS